MSDSPKVPLTNKPGVSNWVEKYGALKGKDNWIRRTAEHIKGKGKPEHLAIPYAVNSARQVCRTGDTNLPGVQQVNAESRTEACAALAIWNSAAAKARANNDLSAMRAFRVVDLAGARLVRGLDLTAQQEQVIDLAFNPDQPRGEHGRWVKALYNRELKRVLRGMKPNNYGTRKDNPTFSRSQINAAKGIARKRTLKRVDEIAKRAVPKRVNSRAMTLTALRERVLDVMRER